MKERKKYIINKPQPIQHKERSNAIKKGRHGRHDERHIAKSWQT